MAVHQEGGCLCGAIRYAVRAEPVRVTICHCTTCQKMTGSAYLVEPIFYRGDVGSSGAAPKVFNRCSDGSGKRVSLHFCGECGTSMFLDFERFPDVFGLFGGTFDDPNWFDRASSTCRHIFTRSAQAGVILPAGVATYELHAVDHEGAPRTPLMHSYPWPATRQR